MSLKHNFEDFYSTNLIGKVFALGLFEGKEIITLAEYAKRENVSHSNLINKAHRQTIEAFMEKGIWKIGK